MFCFTLKWLFGLELIPHTTLHSFSAIFGKTYTRIKKIFGRGFGLEIHGVDLQKETNGGVGAGMMTPQQLGP